MSLGDSESGRSTLGRHTRRLALLSLRNAPREPGIRGLQVHGPAVHGPAQHAFTRQRTT